MAHGYKMAYGNLYLSVVALLVLFQDGHQRFIGDVASSPSLFTSGGPHVSPYTVAIIRDNDFHQRCAGTLLSDSYVITAAQCVDCETAELILGAYDILVKEKTQIRQRITEDDIIFHPFFDPRTLDNDIAIIKLPKKVKLTPFVNIVQLPDPDCRIEYGTNVYLTGWERKLTGYSNILSQSTLSVVSNDKCQSFWPAARINPWKLCAANTHSQSKLPHLMGSDCIIDPGSPLTLHGQPDTLVGILTGNSKCRSLLPEIFVNIASYRLWIDQVLGRSIEVISAIETGTEVLVPSEFEQYEILQPDEVILPTLEGDVILVDEEAIIEAELSDRLVRPPYVKVTTSGLESVEYGIVPNVEVTEPSYEVLLEPEPQFTYEILPGEVYGSYDIAPPEIYTSYDIVQSEPLADYDVVQTNTDVTYEIVQLPTVAYGADAIYGNYELGYEPAEYDVFEPQTKVDYTIVQPVDETYGIVSDEDYRIIRELDEAYGLDAIYGNSEIGYEPAEYDVVGPSVGPQTTVDYTIVEPVDETYGIVTNEDYRIVQELDAAYGVDEIYENYEEDCEAVEFDLDGQQTEVGYAVVQPVDEKYEIVPSEDYGVVLELDAAYGADTIYGNYELGYEPAEYDVFGPQIEVDYTIVTPVDETYGIVSNEDDGIVKDLDVAYGADTIYGNYELGYEPAEYDVFGPQIEVDYTIVTPVDETYGIVSNEDDGIVKDLDVAYGADTIYGNYELGYEPAEYDVFGPQIEVDYTIVTPVDETYGIVSNEDDGIVKDLDVAYGADTIYGNYELGYEPAEYDVFGPQIEVDYTIVTPVDETYGIVSNEDDGIVKDLDVAYGADTIYGNYELGYEPAEYDVFGPQIEVDYTIVTPVDETYGIVSNEDYGIVKDLDVAYGADTIYGNYELGNEPAEYDVFGPQIEVDYTIVTPVDETYGIVSNEDDGIVKDLDVAYGADTIYGNYELGYEPAEYDVFGPQIEVDYTIVTPVDETYGIVSNEDDGIVKDLDVAYGADTIYGNYELGYEPAEYDVFGPQIEVDYTIVTPVDETYGIVSNEDYGIVKDLDVAYGADTIFGNYELGDEPAAYDVFEPQTKVDYTIVTPVDETYGIVSNEDDGIVKDLDVAYGADTIYGNYELGYEPAEYDVFGPQIEVDYTIVTPVDETYGIVSNEDYGIVKDLDVAYGADTMFGNYELGDEPAAYDVFEPQTKVDYTIVTPVDETYGIVSNEDDGIVKDLDVAYGADTIYGNYELGYEPAEYDVFGPQIEVDYTIVTPVDETYGIVSNEDDGIVKDLDVTYGADTIYGNYELGYEPAEYDVFGPQIEVDYTIVTPVDETYGIVSNEDDGIVKDLDVTYGAETIYGNYELGYEPAEYDVFGPQIEVDYTIVTPVDETYGIVSNEDYGIVKDLDVAYGADTIFGNYELGDEPAAYDVFEPQTKVDYTIVTPVDETYGIVSNEDDGIVKDLDVAYGADTIYGNYELGYEPAKYDVFGPQIEVDYTIVTPVDETYGIVSNEDDGIVKDLDVTYGADTIYGNYELGYEPAEYDVFGPQIEVDYTIVTPVDETYGILSNEDDGIVKDLDVTYGADTIYGNYELGYEPAEYDVFGPQIEVDYTIVTPVDETYGIVSNEDDGIVKDLDVAYGADTIFGNYELGYEPAAYDVFEPQTKVDYTVVQPVDETYGIVSDEDYRIIRELDEAYGLDAIYGNYEIVYEPAEYDVVGPQTTVDYTIIQPVDETYGIVSNEDYKELDAAYGAHATYGDYDLGYEPAEYDVVGPQTTVDYTIVQPVDETYGIVSDEDYRIVRDLDAAYGVDAVYGNYELDYEPAEYDVVGPQTTVDFTVVQPVDETYGIVSNENYGIVQPDVGVSYGTNVGYGIVQTSTDEGYATDQDYYGELQLKDDKTDVYLSKFKPGIGTYTIVQPKVTVQWEKVPVTGSYNKRSSSYRYY